MSRRFFNGIVRNKKKTVVLFVLFTLLVLPLGITVHQDFSVERYYVSTSGTRQKYGAFKTLFRRQDEQVYCFFKDPHFSWQSYRDLAAIAEGFSRLGLKEVTWFGNRVSGLTFETRGSFDATKIKAADSFYDGIYWNKARTTFVVSGYLEPGSAQSCRLETLDRDLKKLIAPYKTPGRTLKLSGTPIITTRYFQFIQKDQMVFMGASFVLLFIVMFLIMGSVKGLVLFLLSVIPAWAAIFAILGVSEQPVTALMSILPLILLIVGISDSIHIVTPLKRAREQGDAAVVEVFSRLWFPCFLTSLTTALGFASLFFTNIPAVVSFGLFTALGIMLTYVASMVLFPALLSCFPLKKSSPAERLIDRISRGLPRFVHRFRFYCVGMALLVMATLGIFYRALRVDTYMVDDIKPKNPIVRTIKWIGQEGFGVFKVNLVLKPRVFLGDPKMVAWMRDFARWATQDLRVKKVVSPHHIMDQVNSRLPFPMPDWEVLWGTPTGQRLFAPVYHAQKKTGQIIIFLDDAGTLETKKLVARIHSRLNRVPPPAKAHLTGTTLVAQRSFDSVV
ncbi:MMPL family transporter, partial [Myxococcota bacterium]|nr:MMPL family transporter [Myxococcota bacterium]